MPTISRCTPAKFAVRPRTPASAAKCRRQRLSRNERDGRCAGRRVRWVEHTAETRRVRQDGKRIRGDGHAGDERDFARGQQQVLSRAVERAEVLQCRSGTAQNAKPIGTEGGAPRLRLFVSLQHHKAIAAIKGSRARRLASRNVNPSVASPMPVASATTAVSVSTGCLRISRTANTRSERCEAATHLDTQQPPKSCAMTACNQQTAVAARA
jgi:hypothetical protein